MSMEATDLVHEAFAVLKKSRKVRWESDRQFYVAAATTMRRILIDRARARLSKKRGGDFLRVEFEFDGVPKSDAPQDILELNEALARLANVDQTKADIVEMKFFAGMTIPEIAIALAKSESSVKRDWAFARAWLRSNLESS